MTAPQTKCAFMGCMSPVHKLMMCKKCYRREMTEGFIEDIVMQTKFYKMLDDLAVEYNDQEETVMHIEHALEYDDNRSIRVFVTDNEKLADAILAFIAEREK